MKKDNYVLLRKSMNLILYFVTARGRMAYLNCSAVVNHFIQTLNSQFSIHLLA